MEENDRGEEKIEKVPDPGSFHGFSSRENALSIQQKMMTDFGLGSEESEELSEHSETEGRKHNVDKFIQSSLSQSLFNI